MSNAAVAPGKSPSWKTSLILVCVTFVYVSAFSFGIGGKDAFTCALIGFGVGTVFGWLLSKASGAVAMGLSYGMLTAVACSYVPGFIGLVIPGRHLPGSLLGDSVQIATMAFSSGCATEFGQEGFLRHKKYKLLIVGIALAVAQALVFHSNGYSGLLVTTPVCFAGVWAGAVSGRLLLPRLRVLSEVFVHLKKMGELLGAFVFGYALLGLVFASVYQVAWRENPSGAFSGHDFPPTPNFLHFFYYSVSVMTNLGFMEIHPASWTTRIVAYLEAMCALGWVAIVLGGAASVLHQRMLETRGR